MVCAKCKKVVSCACQMHTVSDEKGIYKICRECYNTRTSLQPVTTPPKKS